MKPTLGGGKRADIRYTLSTGGPRGYAILNGLFGLTAWLWVVAIFGFGMRYLNINMKFLAYAREGVLPFYILHQTVLLSGGYPRNRGHLPDPARCVGISLRSFAISLLIYESLIRRIDLMRVFWGDKTVPRQTDNRIGDQRTCSSLKLA